MDFVLVMLLALILACPADLGAKVGEAVKAYRAVVYETQGK